MAAQHLEREEGMTPTLRRRITLKQKVSAEDLISIANDVTRRLLYTWNLISIGQLSESQKGLLQAGIERAQRHATEITKHFPNTPAEGK